mmetsp:Transcript_66294/g.192075  ORF Transcript_66294/g.192075 Transcript_66294/m.192075 type:complete len:213 (+) Transcript_66294:591-1229(+)
MRGAPQRGGAGGDAGVRICLRASGDAHRGSGCILLMVHVQDHEGVDGFDRHGVRCVLLHRRGKHHIEEILREGEARLGVVRRLAQRRLVGHGSQDRQLRDHAEAGEPSVVTIGRVEFAEHGAESANDSHHHGHGVRIDREVREHGLYLLVDQHVLLDLGLELRLRRSVGELPDEQQVRHLQGFGPFAQVLDGIAAVQADALRPVDEGDRRDA